MECESVVEELRMHIEMLTAAVVGVVSLAAGAVACVERERRKALELVRLGQEEYIKYADRCSIVIEDLASRVKDK